MKGIELPHICMYFLLMSPISSKHINLLKYSLVRESRKNNDSARNVVLRKSNHFDSVGDILRIENRQWLLRERERAESTQNTILNTGSKKSVSSVQVKRDKPKQMYPTQKAATRQIHVHPHHKFRRNNPKQNMAKVSKGQQIKEESRWQDREKKGSTYKTKKKQSLA